MLFFSSCFALTAVGAGTAVAQDEPAYAGLDMDLSGTTIKMAAIGGGNYEAMYDSISMFEEETGHTVEVTLSNNEEMIAKLRATRGAGFDLAQPSQDRISSVQAEFKIYQPIDYTRINSEQIIASMLDAVKKNTMVGMDSYGVPFCYGTSGLIVNTKLAPEAKDYTALLDKASEQAHRHAEARFKWQELLQSAASLSLFAEQRIIELRLPTGKPGRSGGQAIVDLVEQV